MLDQANNKAQPIAGEVETTDHEMSAADSYPSPCRPGQ
jgi:hypothetical protein